VSKHNYLELDPSSHTHSAGEIVGHDGEDLVGPAGRDGVDGKDGKDGAPGRDGVDGTNAGPGPQGAQGDRGPAGADGAHGVDGKDAELPENLVTVDSHSGTLFGEPPDDVRYRLISGVAQLSFRSGYAAFALPEGTQGIVSFSALMISSEPVAFGVARPTDPTSVGLHSSGDGDAEVTYQALIW
jgi:hypothetical protein